jgi:uncharacterized protein DUF1573
MPRRLPLLIVLALLPALLAACGEQPAPAGDGQGLVIQPYDGPLGRGVERRDPRLNFHDFGRVQDGDTVERVFRLRNEDPRPVSITRVDPGCGCTVASLRLVRADGSVERGEPVRSKAERLVTAQPGEVIELVVKIATRDLVTKNNDKLISIRVLTDSPNGYFLTLEVHILAEQAFTVVPGALALGSIPTSGGGRGKVDIVPTVHARTELGALLPPPPGVTAELTREIRNAAPLWTLQVTLEPPLPRGPFTTKLRIATEESPGVPGRELEVPVTATVVDDFAGTPERIVFAAPRGEASRATAEFRSLLAGQRPRVTAVEVPEAHRAWLRASYEPVEPDDAGSSVLWRITLESLPPLPAEQEMLSGKLLVRMDDSQHPSHALEYVVHLR